jgi:hypothetical protein
VKLDEASNEETNHQLENNTMAHMIDTKYDRVYSIEGTEWHGLAIQKEQINDETFDTLSHEIKEVELNPIIEGVPVAFPNHKLLVADVSKSRPDIAPEDRFVPLHIPKAKYGVIDNRAVIDCMKKSFSDLGVKITTAGTLDSLKKFFVSVDIGESEQIINKDQFKCYVNFVTSHDGTMAMDAYDSVIRIVCMNTLNASREAAGEAGFKVYHTKNAQLAMNGLSELFNAILKGRANLREVMEYLASHKCDANDAMAMAAGYFCMETQTDEIAARSYNAAQGIATLFANGLGNSGRTLYDLANGATEYWSSGDGVGKRGKVDNAQRAYRSQFGGAALHKEKFVAMLANDDRRAEALEIGRKAVIDYLAA